MINGKYLAKRTVAHLVNNLGISERKIQRYSENVVSFYGTEYDFKVTGDEIDVRIERINPDEREFFKDYLKTIQGPEFWKKDFLRYLREERKKYKGLLKNLRLDENGGGNCHLKATLDTKNEDKDFFAVFSNIVRPANLFNDERIKKDFLKN